MSKLEPLTFHAVSLKNDFSDMEALLQSFVAGCPGLLPRVQVAVFSSVVSMFFHQSEAGELSSVKKLLDISGAPERLAYACLFALRNTLSDEKKNLLKEKFLFFEKHFSGEVFFLLTQEEWDIPRKLSFDKEDSALCHISNHDICLSDVKKIVDWK